MADEGRGVVISLFFWTALISGGCSHWMADEDDEEHGAMTGSFCWTALISGSCSHWMADEGGFVF
jgi:hypothetical protein